MSDSCRSCRAPVIWLDNVTTGKRAPIDAEPATDGNIAIDDAGHYHVLAGKDREDAIGWNEALHTNHFATCPHAPAWKARAARAAGS
jgi:hypothetical protein